ncbi:hypothetical protein BV20DRAFT_1035223 [Pilatotrama ljubarskyi]|nr:hypothetical protein BV20DRAFT_1035223 [Pilatotrama ljubarskyi]
MHLIWENVVKNLMQLWTGTYKSLDTGSEDYEIEPSVWEAIGEASTASGELIPYIFGPRPPNVASNHISWTADIRSFWIQYVGPVLLERRFKQRKYYDHFVHLVKLICKCLQFELTRSEVEDIRAGFITWVEKFEQFYYQYDLQRLAACPLTIHVLLHIADSILTAGPVWTTWAFPMERYCGTLQPAIRSRRFPYASLNRYVLDHARLTQIKLMYGAVMQESLALCPAVVEKGKKVPGSHRLSSLDRGTIDKLVGVLCTRFEAIPPSVLRYALPNHVEEWGKLRILNEGDTIRASMMDANVSVEDKRDATFVRYEVLVDQNARYRNRPVILKKKTLYGQLQCIFYVQLLAIPLTPFPIQTCIIQRANKDLDIHYYKRLGSVDYVDVTTIQCVVGRIKDDGQFALIDRSGALARAVFVDLD